MKDSGLYIHIPYCRTKCQYCSFVSFPCPGKSPAAYLTALIRQIGELAHHPWLEDRKIATIFIGGGTPTIYDGDSLARLLAACFSKFEVVADPEVTIESNPNAVSLDQLRQCRAAGANRLSIGVQAFDDRLLRAVGRSHSRQEALNAVALARRAGFDNLNLDLMYGLPGQTMDDWRQTMQTAASLAPEHLALYELTIEEGTPFAEFRKQGRLSLPPDDAIIELEDFAYPFLADNGYSRYEISNFAKAGCVCRHNMNYWRNGSYLGLGAGAVSCLAGLRLTNVQDPALYVKMVQDGQPPFAEGEALSTEASFRESVVMGLRLLAGVELDELRGRYGLHPEDYYGRRLLAFIEQGLINLDDQYMKLTAKALPVANQVLSELV